MKYRSIVTSACIVCTAAVLAVGGPIAAGAAPAKGSGGRAPQSGQQAGARPPAPQFVKPAATYLGMKPAEVMKQLKAKKTLASIATAKGKSVDGLKAAIVADAEKHLAADVAAGKLDQAAADAKLAELKTRVNDIVTKPLPARGPGGPGGCRPPAPDGGGTAGTGTGTETGYGTGGQTGGQTGGGTYL